jgi:hypothetical protein
VQPVQNAKLAASRSGLFPPATVPTLLQKATTTSTSILTTTEQPLTLYTAVDIAHHQNKNLTNPE